MGGDGWGRGVCSIKRRCHLHLEVARSNKAASGLGPLTGDLHPGNTQGESKQDNGRQKEEPDNLITILLHATQLPKSLPGETPHDHFILSLMLLELKTLNIKKNVGSSTCPGACPRSPGPSSESLLARDSQEARREQLE